jgi:hypothetical protein
MKRLLFMLVLVLSTLSGWSQVKTVFYDEEDHVISDSTQAASYAIYGKVTGDSLYTFKKFDADGYVTITGAFKDDSLKLAQGKFVYYDWVDDVSTLGNTLPSDQAKDRYVYVTGNFQNGKKTGRWYTFYPNGSLKNVVTFVNDVMNGEFKYFNTKGKLETSGTYVNGKKDGEWVSSGGRKIEQYRNDKVLSTVKKSKKELEAEELAGKKASGS